MRLIHALVRDERRDAVISALEERDIDYVATRADDAEGDGVLVEFPIPSDGVGDVLETLHESGLEEGSYIVVGTAETAETKTIEALEERYASDFSPMSNLELRAKVRDLARDWYSFVWMLVLAAVIATGGLVIESPALVVGSMVIAPIVGPMLTAGVGVVTADRKMLVDSLGYQAVGLVVSVVSAALFALFLRVAGFVPSPLAVSTLDLIAVRLAPGLIAVVVGLAAGGAATFALVTKGPTSLVGVMIAAALIPTAATVGVALIWGAFSVALGAFLLLVITFVAIDAAVVVTLWFLGYRPEEPAGDLTRAFDSVVVVLASIVLVVAVGGVIVGTVEQVTFEREANEAVSDVLDEPGYAALDAVAVRVQFGVVGLPSEPKTVTVTLSRTSDDEYPGLVGRIQEAIAARTGQAPEVRVRYVDYEVAEAASHPSNGSSGSYPMASTAAPSVPSTFSSFSTLM